MLSNSQRLKMLQLMEEALPGEKEWNKAEPRSRLAALKKLYDRIVSTFKPREQGSEKELQMVLHGAEKLDASTLASQVSDALEAWGIPIEGFFRQLVLAL